MKFITLLLIFCFISSQVLFGEAAPAAKSAPLDLENLIEFAQKNNPELMSAKAEWLAAKKRIWIDTSLPDPMVEIAPGTMENEFEASQEILFPGKLWEKGKMAAKEAKAAHFRYRAIERDIVNRLTKAYYDLYYIDASIEVIEEIKGLLKRFESVAQARYSNLSGSQRDVAKTQAEVSLSLERLYSLEQQRESTAAMINALLNRDPMEPVGKAALPEKPILNKTLVELVNLAVIHRQEIKEAEALALKATHNKRLARLAYIPDVSIGFKYTKNKGEEESEDSWMVPISFNVPIWQNRIIPEIQEAKQMENARKAELLQAKNETFAEVKDAFYRYESAIKIADLYEIAVIPQAQIALNADLAGYESNKSDFLNLLDSERVYFNAKLSHVQFLTEALKAYADLVRATGLDFEESKEEGIHE
jgi:outer membrane protein, heavy metal efflux system